VEQNWRVSGSHREVSGMESHGERRRLVFVVSDKWDGWVRKGCCRNRPVGNTKQIEKEYDQHDASSL
jgi:hypothetical protein